MVPPRFTGPALQLAQRDARFGRLRGLSDAPGCAQGPGVDDGGERGRRSVLLRE